MQSTPPKASKFKLIVPKSNDLYPRKIDCSHDNSRVSETRLLKILQIISVMNNYFSPFFLAPERTISGTKSRLNISKWPDALGFACDQKMVIKNF
jgi:hypothetical protein